MANTTASAIGTKRYRPTPVRKNIGTKTMQIDNVDTNAGIAICCAPSRIAGSRSLPCSRCQLMFSIVTVASSTRMPTASASPPRVIMLMVIPTAQSATTADKRAIGMVKRTMPALRQSRRNNSTINPVRSAPNTASVVRDRIAFLICTD